LYGQSTLPGARKSSVLAPRWKSGRGRDAHGAKSWDADADTDADGTVTVTVEWTGWGYDSESAKISAARGVENVIHDLRSWVQRKQQQRQPSSSPLDDNSTVTNFVSIADSWAQCPADSPSSECRILECGRHLCKFYKIGKLSLRINEVRRILPSYQDRFISSSFVLESIYESRVVWFSAAMEYCCISSWKNDCVG